MASKHLQGRPCAEHSCRRRGRHGPLNLFFCRNLIARAQQVMLHREERRRGAHGDADLSVDVLDVVMDGALTPLPSVP